MYLVEGNIGAGKSTLLELISKHLVHVNTQSESVQSWDNNKNGNSLLYHYYQDQNRWAYALETFTLFTRVQEHLKIQTLKNSFNIIERSFYSGYYCFAFNGYQQGFLTSVEWEIYTKWFHFIAQKQSVCPSGFIYLKTTPEHCFKRCQLRNRTSEKNIPFSYFEQIHQKHEDFLIHKKDIFQELKNIPVLVLDATYDFKSDDVILQEYLEKINNFMIEHHP